MTGAVRCTETNNVISNECSNQQMLIVLGKTATQAVNFQLNNISLGSQVWVGEVWKKSAPYSQD